MRKSIVAVLCVLALCLTLLAGCARRENGGGEESPAPTDAPATEPTAEEPTAEPAPATEPAAPPSVDISAAPATEAPAQTVEPNVDEPVKLGESGRLETSIEGETESFAVERYEAVVNGKTLTLFVDDVGYNAYYFEGELEIAPKTEAGVEPPASIHLCYMVGKTADIAAEEGLGQLVGATDAGMTKLGQRDAYRLDCGLEGESFTVYYLDFGEDTLAVSVYGGAETAEGHQARLLAMAATAEA